MCQLSKEDKEVVKRWWKCCKKFIFERGYILDEYNPSLRPSHLPETCRSFQQIVNAGAVIVRCCYSFSLLPAEQLW
jgi:hypothetical protein